MRIFININVLNINLNYFLKDVACNRLIKFKCFREYVKRVFHINVIATGHYARIHSNMKIQDINNKNIVSPTLLNAKDIIKDQTYFLSMTPVETI